MGWHGISCAPSTGAIAANLSESLAGEAVGHHGAIGNARGINPLRIHGVVLFQSGDQHAEEGDVVNFIFHGVAAARAGIPRRHAAQAARAGGIDGEKVFLSALALMPDMCSALSGLCVAPCSTKPAGGASCRRSRAECGRNSRGCGRPLQSSRNDRWRRKRARIRWPDSANSVTPASSNANEITKSLRQNITEMTLSTDFTRTYKHQTRERRNSFEVCQGCEVTFVRGRNASQDE